MDESNEEPRSLYADMVAFREACHDFTMAVKTSLRDLWGGK